MIWLSNSTLARLRDQLRVRGQRPSIATAEPGLGPDALALLSADAEYGPLCEAMYLMMAADGDVGVEERDVLKGALRNLSDDGLRSATIDALLANAEERIGREGKEARLQDVGHSLSGDSARAEVTFVLAAAIAFADNAIADQENETLNELAELLGIDENRANQLLDDVEQDLARAPS